MKDREKRKGPLLRGKGIYAAIAALLLTVGVAGRAVTSLRAVLPGQNENAAPTVRSSDAAVSRGPVASTAAQTPASEAEKPSEQAVFENQTPTVPSEPTTAAAEKRYSLPVNGGVSADYSMGVPVFSNTMGDYRTHNGVDLKAAQGTQVRAIGSGTVVSVAEDRLYGNIVTIDHGDGVVSAVCGLQNDGLIRTGATVDENTVIGLVGEIPAESKEESHVHLEVRKDGALTDPLALLGLDEAEDN